METRRQPGQGTTNRTQPISGKKLQPVEAIREHMKAMEEKDFGRARQYLSDDFLFTGPTPEPIGCDEYVDLHRNLLDAFKDWKYNFKLISEHGDTINGSVRITATHTGTLNLPTIPGVKGIQATGKRVTLPEESLTITLQDGKVAHMDIEQVPNGGVMGLLSQIGVRVQH